MKNICKNCENYERNKCKKFSCRKCYEEMMKSKLKKCPIGKF